VLFLSGASGAGKSSALEGYVLPTLRQEGWRVVEVRSFDDPLKELEDALIVSRRRGTRLLVVFDQFEEFVILEDQADAERRQRFLARVRELRAAPPHGVYLLFAFRTDYQSAVEALDLDELSSRSTWTEIAPFRRSAARRFLEGAPQKPTTALVDRLLDGADALDDLPRLYRPVTLNMLGLALEGFDRAFTGRPERLVQAYLESAVTEKPIREVAPRVIEEMISDATTKRAQSVTQLSATTGLRAPDVTACLNRLAAKGLARRLRGTAGLWELSHDFVARQFAVLLGRLRPSPWPRVTMLASPVLFALAMAGIASGIPIYLEKQASDALRTREQIQELGLSSSAKDGWLSITATEITSDSLAKAGPLLDKLAGRIHSVNLTGTQVANIEPLKGLTALESLDLSGTKVEELEPLRGLTARQTLDLTRTNVQNLEPLRSLTALQTLNLRRTKKVENLEPLKGLSRLMSLDLGETDVENLEPLKGLTALKKLGLSFKHVENLELFRSLITLQSLELSWTRVGNLEPLRGLTAIQSLDLGGTEVEDREPLKGLTTHQSASPSWRKVENLEPLEGLTSLQKLDLSRTNVQNLEPLQGLRGLQALNLYGTQVENLEPLKGLTALWWLNLRETKVRTLVPLNGLTALQWLDLSGTKVEIIEPLEGLNELWFLDLSFKKVESLEPLKRLTALQELSLVGTGVKNLESIEDLTALRKLYGATVPEAERLRFKRYRQEKKLQWVEM
jgi:internalin A